MKHTMKLAGFAFVLAAIALSFAACDNGSTSGGGGATKFEGTWVNHDAIDNYGMTDVSITFTGNNFMCNSVGRGNNNTYRGTFTFNDVAFTWTPAAGEVWSAFAQNYILDGNVLGLQVMNYQLVSGFFTKQ